MEKASIKVFPLIIFVFAIVGLLIGQVLLGERCFAQEQYNQSLAETKVVVTGTYKQEFEADSACVNVQIESLDFDKNISREKNKQVLENVIENLKQEGIEKNDIKIMYTNSYFSREDFSNCCGTRTFTSLCYYIDDLSALNSSIDFVYQAGGEVSSINFKLKDYQSKYNDLLSLATESAKSKAKKLLGKEEIFVSKLREGVRYQGDSQYQTYYQGADYFDSKIEIEAQVEIVAY